MNINTSTKIIMINTSTGEIFIFGDKAVLARYLACSRETVVNWFRETKRVEKSIEGDICLLYKADRFIPKGR